MMYLLLWRSFLDSAREECCSARKRLLFDMHLVLSDVLMREVFEPQGFFKGTPPPGEAYGWSSLLVTLHHLVEQRCVRYAL